MDNINLYVDYFRQLAVRHTLLLHDPYTENGQGDAQHRKFTCLGNNEIIEGLGGLTLGKTCLCIELYERNLSSETVYDIRQRPKGSMMVIDYAENTFSDMLRAYSRAEGILNDLLKKIWQDHYGKDVEEICDRPFKEFRWTTQITPTGKLFTNYYGYYLPFDFDFHNTIDIKIPPADGTFI